MYIQSLQSPSPTSPLFGAGHQQQMTHSVGYMNNNDDNDIAHSFLIRNSLSNTRSVHTVPFSYISILWQRRLQQKIHAVYLLTYAHRSQWSIGHQQPPAIALCSGLLLSFHTSWSPAVSALLQCLASNCCEAGLSSSSPAGSRSGLGVWCWMLAS